MNPLIRALRRLAGALRIVVHAVSAGGREATIEADWVVSDPD